MGGRRGRGEGGGGGRDGAQEVAPALEVIELSLSPHRQSHSVHGSITDWCDRLR